MTVAIRVDRLGKCYPLGKTRQTGYATLRETLTSLAAAPFAPSRARGVRSGGEFWALNDVSFDIKPGQATGIIGRNGAGKSTLLKVLSRITRPSTGEVRLRGRVGSLLEVGTGFHPELTGRENVYLNGSILGMRRHEITRRFDEIVAFSEVEQFLDTPVKRYSSGMYVRLAFAVAAHLEPEILIVDEVLAVGDARFQRKCLGKMSEVSKSGRTVLFVSHNLATVRSLCNHAVHLEQGRVIGQGAPGEQIAAYLARLAQAASIPLADRTDRDGTGQARIVSVRFEGADGNGLDSVLVGDELKVRIEYATASPTHRVDVAAVCFWTSDGVKVLHLDSENTGTTLTHRGAGVVTCKIPRFPLPAGRYQISPVVLVGGEVADHVHAAASLDVQTGDFHQSGKPTQPYGALAFVDHSWA